MIRKTKRGFNLIEVMTTIAVLGFVVVLGIGMFSQSGMDANIDQTKQARLDGALKSAALSVIGKEGTLPAADACSAGYWKEALSKKFANITDTDVTVNEDERTVAFKAKGAGVVVVQIADECKSTWYSGAGVPVAFYTIPDENITALNVPDSVVAGNKKSGACGSANDTDDSAHDTTAKNVSSNPNENLLSFVPTTAFTSFKASALSVRQSYSSSPSDVKVALANRTTTKGASNGDYDLNGICWNNNDYSYTTTCTNTSGEPVVVEVSPYQMFAKDNVDCKPTYCDGNGIVDGVEITTGKINNACNDQKGNVGEQVCPKGREYWFAAYTYSPEVRGVCIPNCSEYENLEPDALTDNICVCKKGTQWNQELKACVDPTSCVEYKRYDSNKKKCVCNETYVLNNNVLAADEVYDASEDTCRRKCPAHSHPSADKKECILDELDCTECMKTANYRTYTCDCDSAKLGVCNISEKRYYNPSTTVCTSPCDDVKVRDPQNIRACICPATEPAGMSFGAFEKYDSNPYSPTCRTCDTANTNRVYDAAGKNCECLPAWAINIKENEQYDEDSPNCISPCPAGQVHNDNYVGCHIPDPTCGCLEKLVNHKCECDENITKEKLEYCKSTGALADGYVFNAAYPDCQAPCNGDSTPADDLKSCACIECTKVYNGTTCVCDASATVSRKCLRNDEKFDGTNPKSCRACKEQNREYDATGACICKRPSEIVFSSPNMKYDPNAATCESPCDTDGIGVRSTTDLSQCVCPDQKPDGLVIDPGMYYNKAAGVANKCQSTCPVGHYCPGTTETKPDVPNVDPNDPINPHAEPDPSYPGGLVYECPCGYYGSQSGQSVSSCSGPCEAGYHCPKGSTSARQEKCADNVRCEAGKCEKEECQSPSAPNANHTACVCPDKKPDDLVIDPGMYYNKAAGVTNKCQSECPKGHYCPGTTEDDKNHYNTGDDPDKIKDTSVAPEGVYLCGCGYFGNAKKQSVYTCNGQCLEGYNCPAGSQSATQNPCDDDKVCHKGQCNMEACTSPFVPNGNHTACTCPDEKPAGMVIDPGKYYNKDAGIANSCQSKCPRGNYCPGTTEDNPDQPNINPNDPLNPHAEPNPNYPGGGVYECPCGYYGSSEGLSVSSCSGSCKAGYYCPKGSTSSEEHECTAGHYCPEKSCQEEPCLFPLTSDSAKAKTCNVCLSEAKIREQQPNYIEQNEEYAANELPFCKKCKSGMSVVNGMCCEYWGNLYFVRQYSEGIQNCTIYEFMNGNPKCFPSTASSGQARQVGPEMKRASEKLSSTDKNRTFNGVFAYMIAEYDTTAKIVGVFTTNTWYTSFTQNTYDEAWQNAQTYTCEHRCNNVTDATAKAACQSECVAERSAACDVQCENVPGDMKQLCIQTCDKFRGKVIANTMTNSCKYVATVAGKESYLNKTLGNNNDEYCTGGKITLSDGCEYNVGAYLRRFASPLVLDLKGNGLKFTSADDGVFFDLNNDGIVEQIAWTAKQNDFDDAFLVYDKNKNGIVDNGAELFGDQNGSANGFIELAKYDDNSDKVINKEDKIYNELLLWVDFNKNARVDYDKNGKTKELKTLEEAGVTEISLDYTTELDSNGKVATDSFGNITGLVGSFKMWVQDVAGKLVEAIRTMIDVFFASK